MKLTLDRINIIETKTVKKAYYLNFGDLCSIYVPLTWKPKVEAILKDCKDGEIDLDDVCDKANNGDVFEKWLVEK